MLGLQALMLGFILGGLPNRDERVHHMGSSPLPPPPPCVFSDSALPSCLPHFGEPDIFRPLQAPELLDLEEAASERNGPWWGGSQLALLSL